MKFGLTDKEIKLLTDVFKKHKNIEKVYIYGSRAGEEHKKTSDIDLMVRFAAGQEANLAQIRSDLEDLPLIYKIDTTSESELKPGEFKSEYERSKKLIYNKNNI